MFRKKTALTQRNLHGTKVVGAGGADIDLQLLARRRSVPFHMNAAPADLAGEGQNGNQAFRSDARKLGDATFDFPVKDSSGFIVAILGVEGGNLHGEDAIGVEARSNILQTHKAAEQQPGGDQEHQRKSEFGND